jgi:hypothetical protein
LRDPAAGRAIQIEGFVRRFIVNQNLAVEFENNNISLSALGVL